MGGGIAHEYMFLCDSGEDTILLCEQCSYAANREVYDIHSHGDQTCLQCGGLVHAVRGIEVGIIWPMSVAPYAVHLVTLGARDDVFRTAQSVYENLTADQVLWDDRDLSAGRKFQDADLLGMPIRVTISPRSLAAGGVELRDRRTGSSQIVTEENVQERIEAGLR